MRHPTRIMWAALTPLGVGIAVGAQQPAAKKQQPRPPAKSPSETEAAVPGAAHAPHHPTPEWIAKFTGKFDHGWNEERERIFKRQKELGVIPSDTKLNPSSRLRGRIAR